jgi:uncharacterized repeat protein (TIGR03803 family)
LFAWPIHAQVSYTQLKSFGDDVGKYPNSLLEGSDGALYGLSGDFPDHCCETGAVFKVNKDGSGYKILRQLTTHEGTELEGLVEGGDGRLYGAAQSRGIDDSFGSTFFSLKKDGSDFRLLRVFSPGEEGSHPGFLSSTRSAIFGTGGGFNAGGVFRYGTDGSVTPIHEFTMQFSDQEGYGPSGLISSGGTLYGTTRHGGSEDESAAGVLFSVGEWGANYSVLHRFARPCGWLSAEDPGTLSLGHDGTLYGAGQGGLCIGDSPSGYGMLFKYDTMGYQRVAVFTEDNGRQPNSPPLETKSTLTIPPAYFLAGTTAGGGRAGGGVLFLTGELMDGLESTVYATHHFGERVDDGTAPNGPLIRGGDGAFYGTTLIGGLGSEGTVFRVDNLNEGKITVVKNFGCPDGVYPRANLIEGSDGKLYGTTMAGGGGGGWCRLSHEQGWQRLQSHQALHWGHFRRHYLGLGTDFWSNCGGK